MLLNLGSGVGNIPNAVNADIQPCRVTDVCCCASLLPFKAESFTRILFIHCLEHLWPRQALQAFREMLRVLKPSGDVVIEGPDIKKVITLYMDDYPKLMQCLYGDTFKYGGSMPDTHKWGWTEQQVAGCLSQTGFSQVGIGEAQFHGHPKRDFLVVGKK